MTMRDVQWSLTDTSAAAPLDISTYTQAGSPYLAPNTIDTSPLGAYLTALTSADTQLSGNVNTYRDLGGGSRMWIVIDVVTAVTSAGSATIDFALITSASTSLGSATTMYDFSAVGKANLTKGTRLIAALPRSTSWLQYVGLQLTIGTADLTGGKIVAWIAPDVDAVNLGGASGFSIK